MLETIQKFIANIMKKSINSVQIDHPIDFVSRGDLMIEMDYSEL